MAFPAGRCNGKASSTAWLLLRLPVVTSASALPLIPFHTPPSQPALEGNTFELLCCCCCRNKRQLEMNCTGHPSPGCQGETAPGPGGDSPQRRGASCPGGGGSTSWNGAAQSQADTLCSPSPLLPAESCSFPVGFVLLCTPAAF